MIWGILVPQRACCMLVKWGPQADHCGVLWLNVLGGRAWHRPRDRYYWQAGRAQWRRLERSAALQRHRLGPEQDRLGRMRASAGYRMGGGGVDLTPVSWTRGSQSHVLNTCGLSPPRIALRPVWARHRQRLRTGHQALGQCASEGGLEAVHGWLSACEEISTLIEDEHLATLTAIPHAGTPKRMIIFL